MDIQKLKDAIENTSINYPFFQFQTAELKKIKTFSFPISQFRTFNNSGAKHLGKPITRTLTTDLEIIDKHERSN